MRAMPWRSPKRIGCMLAVNSCLVLSFLCDCHVSLNCASSAVPVQLDPMRFGQALSGLEEETTHEVTLVTVWSMICDRCWVRSLQDAIGTTWEHVGIQHPLLSMQP